MARVTSPDLTPAFPSAGNAPACTTSRRRQAFYAVSATLLFLTLLVFLNAIAWRFPFRVRLGREAFERLSARTRDAVSDLTAPLTIDCVLSPDHPLYDAIRARLLDIRDMAGATGAPVTVRFIDPRRDLRLVETLLPDLDGAREAILLRSGTRLRRLVPDELVERRLVFSGADARAEWSAFRGDAVIGAALRAMNRQEPVRLYVVTGQGERGLDNYDPLEGYSDMARALRRHAYQLPELNLAKTGEVPRDADAVLILGPRIRFTDPARQALRRYLAAGGRLLVLLDPGVDVGLDPLLRTWGVQVLPAVVMGGNLTGEQLVVHRYAEHAVTRSLRNAVTLFSLPAAIAMIDPVDYSAPDRPTVIPLAGVGSEGWIVPLAMESAAAGTPVQPGPVPVAVAVERGEGSVDLRVRPTRLVIIGDSGFCANTMFQIGAVGNRDFFLNAVAWLTDAHAPAGASAVEPVLLVVLGERGWLWLWIGIGLAWPVVLGGLGGVVVGIRRRRAR